MHHKFLKLGALLLILALIGWGVYAIVSAPKSSESEIVSDHGSLHLHAHLSIVIKGKSEVIPADIGTTGPMSTGGDPMQLHTHDTSGVIHAEFEGIVTKDQLRLKNFFDQWGKDFSKDSILGNKNGDGGTITMTVNGVPNTDFENYVITGKGTYDAGDLGKIDDIVVTYQ